MEDREDFREEDRPEEAREDRAEERREASRPREESHRVDIPGLAGDADFCTDCNDYCGGEYEQCECCGGKGTAARVERGELSDETLGRQDRDEVSGAPNPGGTQVSPQTGPGREQEYPSVPRPGDQPPDTDE